MVTRVEVYYSLQSDYCYFLLDRLIELSNKNIDVVIRPVLGGVIRAPSRYLDRSEMEQAYFETDTKRVAEYLGLPYAYPNPSPIKFKPASLWVAEANQPLNEYLNRIFVGSVTIGKGLEFLNNVSRMLWDGSTQDWDKGDHLRHAMAAAGMELNQVLEKTDWESAKQMLDENATSMLTAGHWGVPLLIYGDEPFYGQDRFDQLVWRMKLNGDLA